MTSVPISRVKEALFTHEKLFGFTLLLSLHYGIREKPHKHENLSDSQITVTALIDRFDQNSGTWYRDAHVFRDRKYWRLGKEEYIYASVYGASTH